MHLLHVIGLVCEDVTYGLLAVGCVMMLKRAARGSLHVSDALKLAAALGLLVYWVLN